MRSSERKKRAYGSKKRFRVWGDWILDLRYGSRPTWSDSHSLWGIFDLGLGGLRLGL